MTEPARLDIDPDNLSRGLSQVVLVVLELLRELLERQAVRRMEGGELTDDEVERLGRALMKLKDRLQTLRAQVTDTDIDELAGLVEHIVSTDLEGLS